MSRGLKKSQAVIPAAYLLVEIGLSIAVQLTHGAVNKTVSYALVGIAFLFTFYFAEQRLRYLFMQLGLAFTLCADLFLLILNRDYVVGVSFFVLAQLCYFGRIYLECDSERVRKIHLIVRGAVIVLSLVLPAIVLGDRVDLLSIISVLYFANLVLNTAFAFVDFKKNPILPIALLLFCFCDVFVGFSNMSGYFSFERGTLAWWLAHPGFNAAWLFYSPSQMLLGISLLPVRIGEMSREKEKSSD